jgi:hypothetical protein
MPGADIDIVSPLTIDEFDEELHAWSGIRRALGIEEPKE